MAFAKHVFSCSCRAWSRFCADGLLVLLLLPFPRVPRRFPPTFLIVWVVLIASGFVSSAAEAVERTFVLAPADVVSAPDLFGAKALSRSATLGRAVGLKSGAVRFAKGVCPSLMMDPTRRVTRVRLLGGPTGAPLVVGRSLGSGLTSALNLMNAGTWNAPATGSARQPHWVVEAPIADAIGFETAGFAVGDQTGALGKDDAATRALGFRMDVDLTSDPGVGAAELALAITIELPPKRLGKPGKRTECIVVASLLPVDLQALHDLVNAAPLSSVTQNRLNFMLTTAEAFLHRGHPDRAARNVRTFALEVAQRSATEIPPAHAEAMINRANAAAEALGF